MILVALVLARRRRRAADVQHLDAAGVLHRHRPGARPTRSHAQEQSLQMELDQLRDPQRVATRAQSLGMVPLINPAFIRLEDGTVLGNPVPAAAADGQRLEPMPSASPPRCAGADRRRGADVQPDHGGRRRALGRAGPCRQVQLTATSDRAATDRKPNACPSSAPANGPEATGRRPTGRGRASRPPFAWASLLRLRVGFLIIAMVVSVFAARLFQLQGLDATAYAERAGRRRGAGDPPGHPRLDHRPQRRPAGGVRSTAR